MPACSFEREREKTCHQHLLQVLGELRTQSRPLIWIAARLFFGFAANAAGVDYLVPLSADYSLQFVAFVESIKKLLPVSQLNFYTEAVPDFKTVFSSQTGWHVKECHC